MISLWAFAKHTSMLWVLISSCGFACSRFVIFVGWVLIIICTNWMFKICILLARVLVIIYTHIKHTTKFHTLFKICIDTHTHTQVQEYYLCWWILNSWVWMTGSRWWQVLLRLKEGQTQSQVGGLDNCRPRSKTLLICLCIRQTFQCAGVLIPWCT